MDAHKALYAPQATYAVLFATVGSPWGLVLIYLLLINLGAFLAFGVDKWKSKRSTKRRIPERNLLLAAVAGGSVGALLGMKVFRHKTLHRMFRRGIPMILLVQVVLAVGLWVYFGFIR